MGGWGQKMEIFVDLQYYFCWRRWVGLKKPKTCWCNYWMVPYHKYFWWQSKCDLNHDANDENSSWWTKHCCKVHLLTTLKQICFEIWRLCWYQRSRLINDCHTVNFDWFLSGLEWILNLEFFFTKTFDILPEIIVEYQI